MQAHRIAIGPMTIPLAQPPNTQSAHCSGVACEVGGLGCSCPAHCSTQDPACSHVGSSRTSAAFASAIASGSRASCATG